MKTRLLALAASAALASPAWAATFEVTRTDDPTPNGCEPEDCSLREAVLAANLLPDSTVNVPAGTYRLSIVRGEADPDDGTKGNLVVSAPMTIAGAGMEATIVDARPDDGEATLGVDRVLTIRRQGAPVSITGLTLAGGYLDPEDIFAGQGGCLFLQGGTANLTQVRVTGCFSGSGGGGVKVGSALNDMAQVVEGALTMTDCEVTHNDAIRQTEPFVLGGSGGGIQVIAGSATLTDTLVADNRGSGGGGIGVSRQDVLEHPDDLTLLRAEVARNYSGLNGGGGIAIDSGNATIRDSYIHDNIAGGAGGGINIFNATKLPRVDIEGSLIAGNVSGANEDGSSPAIPSGSGGGVRNSNGVLTILNSTITGNEARGTLIEVGPGIPPIRTSGFGGGLSDSGATGTEPIGMILNSTIAYNVGVSSSQVWEFSSAAGSPLGLANTIVAGTGLADAAPNCGKNGPKDGFKSLGGNLSSDASPCRFLELTDMAGVAVPGLAMTLADNGGETDTLALLAGSPAIGLGVEDHCPETDQRGVARKAKCDAGAFERVDALAALRMSLEEAVQIPDSDLGGFVTRIRALAGLP